MAVTKDGAAQSATHASSTITISRTIGASANLIYIVILGRGVSRDPNGVTAVTVGGVAAERILSDSTGYLTGIDVYRLVSPPTGTQDVIATRGTNGYAPVVMIIQSFIGANIALPDGGVTRATANSPNGSPYTHTRTIASTADGYTCSALSAVTTFSVGDATVGFQTEDIDTTDADARIALFGTAPGASPSVTHSWDLDADAGGREACSVAWNVNAAADTGGGGEEPPPTPVEDPGETLLPVARFEVWSSFECAPGVRLSSIADVTRASDRWILQDENTLTVTIPADSLSAPFVRERRVLRTIDVAGGWTEWLITGVTERAAAEGSTIEIACASVTRVFSQSCVVTRSDANGAVWGDFEAPALRAQQHLEEFILPAAAAAGYGWFQLGTIAPLTTVDLVYEWSSPLDCVKRLADLTDCEWRIRRDGTTCYRIDLLPQIASAAVLLRAAGGANLAGIVRARTTTEMANRVYPRGADEGGGIRATMARNRWRVTAVVAEVLTLADPGGGAGPVAIAGQWVDLSVRKVGGTPAGIVASDPLTQTVEVDDATGFAVNDLVELCINGEDLLFVSAPSSIETYGGVVGVVERPDIPATVNLLRNPAMRLYGGASGPPDSWGAVGSPTLTRITDRAFWRAGGHACRVQAAADGDGLRSSIEVVLPTSASPLFSFFAGLWVVSGQVRVELVWSDGSVTRWWPSGQDGKASSGGQVGTWVFDGQDSLGGEGLDLFALAATSAYVRVVQDGPTAAEFYVDCMQLTQSAAQQPFVDGSGSTQLVQEANRQLLDRLDPGVRYDVTLIDRDGIARMDPALAAEWNRYPIILGGPIALLEESLPIEGVTTRILEVQRQLRPGRTLQGLTLSSRPDDVIDTLVRPPLPGRLRRNPTAVTRPLIDIEIRDVPGTPGQSKVFLTAQPDGASIYFVVDDAGEPVPIIGASAYQLYTGPFTVDRIQDQPLQIAAYARLGGAFSEIAVRTVDQDTLPSVTVSVGESAAGTARVNWTPDDDVVAVRLYRRVDATNWPTLDGTVGGTLDEADFIGTIDVRPDGGSIARDGTPLANVVDAGGTARTGIGGTSWQQGSLSNGNIIRVIVVPRDRNGNLGARASASRTMAGTASAVLTAASQSALTDSGGGSLSNGEQIHANLAWSVSGGVVDGTHDLRIYQRTNGGPWVELTGQLVTTPASTSSKRVPTGLEFRNNKWDPYVEFEYKLELIQTSGSIVLDSKVTLAQSTTTNPFPL